LAANGVFELVEIGLCNASAAIAAIAAVAGKYAAICEVTADAAIKNAPNAAAGAGNTVNTAA
jgi:hypothetical protein